MEGAVRTQVYISAEQRARLDELRRLSGKPLAELVREALEAYVEDRQVDVDHALDATFGAAKGFKVPARWAGGRSRSGPRTADEAASLSPGEWPSDPQG